MNATCKALVKIEVCRNILGSLSSDKEASTLLWMADELDNAFVGVCSDCNNSNIAKDISNSTKFINTYAEHINNPVPERVTAIFLVSAMGYVFGNFDGTNKYKHVESLLDACLELDGVTGSEEDVNQRKLASVFADNLEYLVNR